MVSLSFALEARSDFGKAIAYSRQAADAALAELAYCSAFASLSRECRQRPKTAHAPTVMRNSDFLERGFRARPDRSMFRRRVTERAETMRRRKRTTENRAAEPEVSAFVHASRQAELETVLAVYTVRSDALPINRSAFRARSTGQPSPEGPSSTS